MKCSSVHFFPHKFDIVEMYYVCALNITISHILYSHFQYLYFLLKLLHNFPYTHNYDHEDITFWKQKHII